MLRFRMIFSSYIFRRRHHAELINQIFLPAVNKTVDIHYHVIRAAKKVVCKHKDDKLILYGKINKFSDCVSVIKDNLKKQAYDLLLILLDQISLETNLKYTKLSVRAQKTMWGSCTSKGNIQLNYKILFLQPELARYILIHELCHTVHLNHSRHFWNLVEQFLPDYRAHVKTLKTPNDLMPFWMR